MARRVKIGLVQPNIWDDMDANVAQIAALARQARADGAELIATPENSGFMGANAAASVAAGRPEERHPALQAFRDLAKEMSAWFLVGSIAVKPEGANRNFNRSYLLAPDGEIAARYDKIHLFDVDIPGRNESYRESAHVAPGRTPVVVDTPAGRLGMAVCYDVRFPELFRRLSAAGAQWFSVPSAFTGPTGRAHWETLLRARAIENLSYVVAPAQSGFHANGRETYGDSLIADYWGRVLRRLPRGRGCVVAEIDLEAQAAARESFPALGHRVL